MKGIPIDCHYNNIHFLENKELKFYWLKTKTESLIIECRWGSVLLYQCVHCHRRRIAIANHKCCFSSWTLILCSFVLILQEPFSAANDLYNGARFCWADLANCELYAIFQSYNCFFLTYYCTIKCWKGSLPKYLLGSFHQIIT